VSPATVSGLQSGLYLHLRPGRSGAPRVVSEVPLRLPADRPIPRIFTASRRVPRALRGFQHIAAVIRRISTPALHFCVEVRCSNQLSYRGDDSLATRQSRWIPLSRQEGARRLPSAGTMPAHALPTTLPADRAAIQDRCPVPHSAGGISTESMR